MSWKQHWVQSEFSSPDWIQCDQYEKNQFSKCLKESRISILPTITAREGRATTLNELVNMVPDKRYKGIPKSGRQVVYGVDNGVRPVGRGGWEAWNGWQVVDMDIKNHETALALKPVIFNALRKCNWFLGVVLSSSGNGLHIYTKIAIPEDIHGDINRKKLLYLANFRHKYSFAYISCLDALGGLGLTKDDLMGWLDVAMAKPQQGAFIPYDPHPMFNTGFFEDFIYICFDNIEYTGHPDIDWVSHPDLKELFARWEWFGKETPEDGPEVEVVDKPDPDLKVNTKIHYKHNDRWRLANTLVQLYGLKDGYRYLRAICSNKTRDKELYADCQTAARYKKPVDTWAVGRLNTMHGFNIKLNVSGPVIQESDLLDAMNMAGNPNSITKSRNYKEFHIGRCQYLGSIIHDLMDNFGRITLLEAGPGLGKTEMVKQLVRMGKKVMMVQPFTSIIKSKVEQEEGWYNSYGNRKPKLDVEHGLALTMDKFSRLNMMDVKAHGFDYIFIDESHLIFMSEYRPIMAQVINQIRISEVPVVLMSGTPIGELVFFNDIVHLNIIKEETRKKELQIRLVNDQGTLLFHMCKAMAEDIKKGNRILFPSNEGTLFYKRVCAGVEYFLRQDAIFEPLISFYYKKSNLGCKEMDLVNFEKTIKDAQLVMCTTYAGAGVDINDHLNFRIYFADVCTAAECDQWCNRLRNNNLFVRMYVARNDADGNPRYINKFKPINLKLNDEEIKDVHSILRLCNGMIERNPMDYKYNSLISSIINQNQYIRFNEEKNKYELDELSYKVVFFERKYREFAQQLPVFMKGMKLYGYQVDVKDDEGAIPSGQEVFKDLKTMVRLAAEEQLNLNTADIEELLDLITDERISLYKDVMKGSFEIRKGNCWKEDLNTNVMTVKNVEVFEKVVPIAISLSNRFTIPVVKEIFEFCRKPNGHFNFAALGRIRTLINIITNAKAHHLDKPMEDFMEKAYEISDKETINKVDLKKFIIDFCTKYAEKESSVQVLIARSELTIKKMVDTFEKIFKCLVKCSRPAQDGTITMERVEILWKTREEQMGDIIKSQYLIPSFMDQDIPTKDITITNTGNNPDNAA